MFYWEKRHSYSISTSKTSSQFNCRWLYPVEGEVTPCITNIKKKVWAHLNLMLTQNSRHDTCLHLVWKMSHLRKFLLDRTLQKVHPNNTQGLSFVRRSEFYQYRALCLWKSQRKDALVLCLAGITHFLKFSRNSVELLLKEKSYPWPLSRLKKKKGYWIVPIVHGSTKQAKT